MSGTSARESYRSSKRTRPSDSQPSRMTPPVLFRLPSVPMPGQDSAAVAGNANAAAMAMPMSSAPLSAATMAAATMQSSVAATVQSATTPVAAPSGPAQSAAATISEERASGQRLLNMLIVVLLVAALAIITWISLNRRGAPPALADNKVGNDSALSTLGELKVPEMASDAGKTVSTSPADKSNEQAPRLSVDELKPSNPADLSMIDLPDTPSPTAIAGNATESLLTGLDTSGTDSSLVNSSTTSSASPSSSNTASAPTAQIQLRTPVPVGNVNATSLVDASRPAGQLGGTTPESSNSARFETVSAPSQTTKIFPANAEPTQNSTTPSSSTKNNNSSAADGSPSLWDGAQRSAQEGLQLSGQPTVNNNSATQVNISRPLTAEINVASQATTVGDKSSSDTTNTLANDNSLQGTTVGGGASEPYNLAENLPPAAKDLQKSRADLNPTMLARVAASGVAKSAVSNSASLPPNPNKPINSYVGATSTNTVSQNLYTNGYVNPAPTNTTGPINAYASQANVPAGVTGSGAGAYVPPTASMPNAAGQYAPNQQLVSGPTSAPGMTASFAIPPRGNPTNNNQNFVPNNQTFAQPQQPSQLQQRYQPAPGAPAGYAQPGSSNPTGNAQQGYSQPSYQQQSYPQQGYAQPGYAQPTALPGGSVQTNAYGQPSPYGAAGSGYANPAYATPSAGMPANMPTGNMPGMNVPSANVPSANMPGANYQRNASYPVNPMPGGQVSVGLIGPAGNATPPSGDIAPTPVFGTGGVRTSTPYGSPQ